MNQYHADGFPSSTGSPISTSNGNPNGRHPDKGTLAWHTDGSWSAASPRQATIIYGEVVPEHGGETHFCDMYGAYERLDAGWKARIAGMRAVHNLDFSRTRRHGEQPMTRRAARGACRRSTTRSSARIRRPAASASTSAIMPSTIVGMPYDEGRALIDELNASRRASRTSPTSIAGSAGELHRLGQPLRDASCDGLRPRDAASRGAAVHGAGRSAGLAGLQSRQHATSASRRAYQRQVPSTQLR